VIAALEIGAVGSMFSKRTSWRARENPGKTYTCLKYIHTTHECILNEEMMPDVTILFPELGIVKNVSNTKMSMDKGGGTRSFQNLHPYTSQFLIFFKKILGASPAMDLS
jgi:hypothetical protein